MNKVIQNSNVFSKTIKVNGKYLNDEILEPYLNDSKICRAYDVGNIDILNMWFISESPTLYEAQFPEVKTYTRFHSKQVIPSSEEINFIENTPYLSLIHTFEGKLLEYPYETNCFNYRPVGFYSRAHCIENCLIKSDIKHYGRIDSSRTITKQYGDYAIQFDWSNEIR